jgi:hypothetical protein
VPKSKDALVGGVAGEVALLVTTAAVLGFLYVAAKQREAGAAR